MLPKRQRLTAAEGREILKSVRSARTAPVPAKSVGRRERKAGGGGRTKGAKSAVARNRLRRAAYDALRPVLPAGKSAVFFLHKPALYKDELISLCSKLS